MPDDEGAGRPVGSVADEAASLLESLRRASEVVAEEAAGESRPVADEPTSDAVVCEHCGHVVPAPGGTSSHRVGMGEATVCDVCPACRMVGVLKTVSPDVVERFADLATSAAALLQEIAGSWPSPEPHPERGVPTHQRSESRRAERIEIIDEEDED